MSSSWELERYKPHVLVVPAPTQGHINPMLQFAKRLVSKSVMVTFVITEASRVSMLQAQNAVPGESDVQFETISDGFPLDFDRSKDTDAFIQMLVKMGTPALENLIERLNAQGNKISCIIYDSFLPWVLEVATKFNIPAAFFWTQSCAVYAIYHSFFSGLEKIPEAIEISGLPLLSESDMPTLLQPSNCYPFMFQQAMDQFKSLPKATWVLGNSFSELESEEIDSMKSIAPIRTVGPLIPSASLDGGNLTDTASVAHMWKATNCTDWLNTKEPESVVYVSFGSLAVLSKEQMHEIALGLKVSGYCFLWVIRPPSSEVEINSEETLPAGFLNETAGQGLVVPWCHQLQVLSHASVGAFMTHCGWNSTLESVSFGVPMLALPQWSDQTTNSAYVERKWNMGMRLKKREADGLVGKEEVEKCLKTVMESQLGGEMRKNALQWKKLSKEAMVKGGSSERNIQEFVDEVIASACLSSSPVPEFSI